MLAALLTVLLLTQTLCITAFAENPVEVLIPQGSEESDKNTMEVVGVQVRGYE